MDLSQEIPAHLIHNYQVFKLVKKKAKFYIQDKAKLVLTVQPLNPLQICSQIRNYNNQR